MYARKNVGKNHKNEWNCVHSIKLDIIQANVWFSIWISKSFLLLLLLFILKFAKHSGRLVLVMCGFSLSSSATFVFGVRYACERVFCGFDQVWLRSAGCSLHSSALPCSRARAAHFGNLPLRWGASQLDADVISSGCAGQRYLSVCLWVEEQWIWFCLLINRRWRYIGSMGSKREGMCTHALSPMY